MCGIFNDDVKPKLEDSQNLNGFYPSVVNNNFILHSSMIHLLLDVENCVISYM